MPLPQATVNNEQSRRGGGNVRRSTGSGFGTKEMEEEEDVENENIIMKREGKKEREGGEERKAHEGSDHGRTARLPPKMQEKKGRTSRAHTSHQPADNISLLIKIFISIILIYVK